MIEINNVSKKYNGKKSVDDVSFQMNEGEVIGLLGANGSGKTTLMELLCGLRLPTEGEILYEGKKVDDNVVYKEKIAYIRDEQNHMGNYRAASMVRMYQRNFEHFDKEKFNQLNTLFQVDLNMPIKKLSKGQRMCVAFMLALAQNAEFIFLDEPFGGVDVAKQKMMREYLIKEIESRSVGIMLSTHNVGDLVSLCDRVIFMKDGKIGKIGSVDDLTEEIVEKYEANLTESQISVLTQNEDILVKPQMGLNCVIYKAVGGQGEGLAERLKNVGAEEIQKKPVALEECYFWYSGNLKSILDI